MLSFDISNKCYEMCKLESQILKTPLYLPFQLLFEQMVKKNHHWKAMNLQKVCIYRLSFCNTHLTSFHFIFSLATLYYFLELSPLGLNLFNILVWK